MKINYVLVREKGFEDTWVREGDLRKGEVIISRDESQISLEELAHICDTAIEQSNEYHGFTGQHRILAQLLFNQFGRKEATKFMLTLAKYGGLPETDGIYHELGIEEPWSDFVIVEGG